MRKEYLHHLDSLLELREEDCNVRKQQEESKANIDLIANNLLNDNILINHFRCIVKETEQQLRDTNTYTKLSLDDLNEKFLSRTKKLKMFWSNYNSLKSFFESYSFFKVMLKKAEYFQDNHFTLNNLIDTESHHSWIKEVIDNKKVIIDAWERYNQLKSFLNKYPLFLGIRKEFSVYENKLSLSKSLDEIKIHLKWIIEINKNKNIIENAWNDYKSLNDFLNQNALFKGISNELSKYAKYFSSECSLDAIKKHHEWIKSIQNDRANLNKILKDLHDLMKYLSDKKFKGLENELLEHKNKISEAKNVMDMKESHSWISYLIITRKGELEFIHRNLRDFTTFVNSKNKFFEEKKWFLELEEEAARLKNQNEVLTLNKKVIERKRLIDSIKSITQDWEELNKLILETGYDNKSIITDLKKLNSLFKSYEKNGKLNNKIIEMYQEKIKRKMRSIKGLIHREYPKIGWVDLDDIGE